jgi:hypothetical protein
MLRVDCITVVQNYVGHRSLSLACDFAIYSPKCGGEDNNVFVMVKSTYQLYMLKESCGMPSMCRKFAHHRGSLSTKWTEYRYDFNFWTFTGCEHLDGYPRFLYYIHAFWILRDSHPFNITLLTLQIDSAFALRKNAAVKPTDLSKSPGVTRRQRAPGQFIHAREIASPLRTTRYAAPSQQSGMYSTAVQRCSPKK